jgi:hypothetical protein
MNFFNPTVKFFHYESFIIYDNFSTYVLPTQNSFVTSTPFTDFNNFIKELKIFYITVNN